MDSGTLVFFLAMTVACLWIGFSSFFGKNAAAYSPPFFSARLLLVGVLLLVMFTVTFFLRPISDTNDHVISYICFALGLVCLAGGVAIAVSKSANAAWWRFTRRQPQVKDRQYLVFVLLVLSFGFFFSWFLFYPPFLSIG
jgi:antibiotic biosynthesis monooxygenase (ABM) superfamily enzyme